MPLTKEQFLELDSQGFSPEEIAGFEKRRETELANTGKPFQRKSIFPPPTKDVLTETIAGTGRDITAIPAHFLNQFLANVPRAATHTAGYEYPEKTVSPAAGVLAKGAGVVGGVLSPLNKIAIAKNISKSGLLPKILSSAAAGGAYAGGDTLQESYKPENVALRSTISGIIPAAVKGGQKIKEGIKLLDKSKVGYLWEKVAGPASEKVKTTIREFPKTMEDYAKNKLGLSSDSINTIKKYGYDKVVNPDIAEEEAKTYFSNVMSQTPTGYGGKINAQKTLHTLDNIYKTIDKDIAKKNPVYNKLFEYRNILRSKQPAPEGFYKKIVPTPTQLGRQLKGKENLIDIAKEVRMNKETFSTMRDDLSRLYKDSGSDANIKKVIDSMYDDMENSGLKGIQEARKAYREFHEISKASKSAMKLEKKTQEKIHADLLRVKKDPEQYAPMVKEYKPYFGDETEAIFNEALAASKGEKAKKLIGKTAKYGSLAAASAAGFNLYRHGQR